MTTIVTSRPRNVDYLRAAALLYGDLGTSKAYVLGLAFLLAGRSSFWYILAISALTFLVGISYVFITKSYPTGGGVYTSVRHRSKILALVGAFFLISDYLVTAALSSVSAFHYLGVPEPAYWAIASVGIIGLLNLLGPKHTGSLALVLAIPTMIAIAMLGLLSLPFLPNAVQALEPISQNFLEDWNIFVGIIVALSGIESIANATSSMKLDPGSTLANPSVEKTSTPAILLVILEVCVFTTLLGLAMNALPGMVISGDNVSAPGYPNVRDAMLRYMSEIFAGSLFGPVIGHAFSIVVMILIALLLLSAVNTSLVALISLLYILSKDEEMPQAFQKLNSFGVPVYPAILSFSLPMIILIFVSDVAGLANLYAIGFVGAIAVNLIATSTNLELPLKPWQRTWMMLTFLIMAAAEVTLFIDKPQARNFVLAIISSGLLLRALAKERMEKAALAPETLPTLPQAPSSGGIMVALNDVGKSLEYALEEAHSTKSPLHILFVREQIVVADGEEKRHWTEDKIARKVVERISLLKSEHPIGFLYTITDHPVHSIVEIAKQKHIQRIILGRQRGVYTLLNILRGNSIRSFSKHLPKEIDLVIIV